MLDKTTKTIINNARNILVGKVPNPQSQVDLITIAMIYKFMDDMDTQNIELGGNRVYFTDDLAPFAWKKLLDSKVGHFERLNLYSQALDKLQIAKQVPQLFRDIFKGAFLPFRDGATLTMFLKEIDNFSYSNSENLGNAFEYLLSIMGAQGDAGQFRTPRHIIDFIVEVVNPTKTDTILDPACGTAGFLISAYKHIIKQAEAQNEKLSPKEMKTITDNIVGYDISPDMKKLALVNLYLHQFPKPKIYEYDTLTQEERWADKFNVILANPPFMSPKGGIIPHNKFGVKANRAEVLFADYIMEHLTLNGKAGVVVPEGIIFQSATAYKALRKMMVEEQYLYAVVSLPSGVFNPYSGVKTSILFFDRNLAKISKDILFLKVENDGFDLGAQRREINENDLPKSIEILKEYQQCLLSGQPFDDKKYSKSLLVSKDKISQDSDYNLTAARYEQTIDHSNCQYEMVKLGDICELTRGITYSKDEETDKSKNIVLRANNINLETQKLDLSDLKYLKEDLVYSDKKFLRKNDIFICLASGSKEHIGKVAFIDEDLPYMYGGFMGSLRAKSNHNSKYIYYVLASKIFKQYLKTTITGVNINNLNSKILYQFELPLPPLDVQEEIVKELDQYQAIIDGAQKIIDNWKPTFTINPNWEKVKLGDVCEIQSGGTPLKSNKEYWNGSIKWYTSGELNNFYTEDSKDKITLQGLENSNAKIFPKGSLLIGMYDTAAFKMSILQEDASFNQAISGVKPNNRIDMLFLYLFLLKNKEIYMKQRMGVRQQNLNKGFISNIEILLPNLKEQKAIVEKIEKEKEYIDACKSLIELNKQKIADKIKSIWNCNG